MQAAVAVCTPYAHNLVAMNHETGSGSGVVEPHIRANNGLRRTSAGRRRRFRQGGAEKRAVLRPVISPRLKSMGTQTAKGQPLSHLEPRDSWAASKALLEARQPGLSHPRASCFHSRFGCAVHCSAEVRSRCECCGGACTLASLSTFGYTVQRKAIAGAVSEWRSGEEKRKAT